MHEGEALAKAKSTSGSAESYDGPVIVFDKNGLRYSTEPLLKALLAGFAVAPSLGNALYTDCRCETRIIRNETNISWLEIGISSICQASSLLEACYDGDLWYVIPQRSP